MTINLFVQLAWFVLGFFFGIVCTYAWVENANARTMEAICKDLEDS